MRCSYFRDSRGIQIELRLKFPPERLGDKVGLLNDYYSARSDSAKKAISKLSRIKSENLTTSTRTTSRSSRRTTNYGTTSSASSHACWSPKENILNHHQISTSPILNRPGHLHHKTKPRQLLWVPQQQVNYVRSPQSFSSINDSVWRNRTSLKAMPDVT